MVSGLTGSYALAGPWQMEAEPGVYDAHDPLRIAVSGIYELNSSYQCCHVSTYDTLMQKT